MIKRLFDVAVASTVCFLTLPLQLCIGVMVKLEDRGPVLFRAERIGRDGVLFDVLKFRSMIVVQDPNAPAVTASGDARITRIGAIIRRSKLDELPQLINVIRGEMSLVGPRPEAAVYVATYTPEQREVLGVRPGITSTASIKYRNEETLLASADDWDETYRTIMADKLELDREYVANQSMREDLTILFNTIRSVVTT